MTYFETVNEAIDLTVVTDSVSGMSYLEPRYRMLLRDNGIALQDDPNNEELYELLQLEVTKRNAQLNRLQPVLDWIYDTVSNTVEPAITQEENEMMKNLVEYMRLNQERKANDKELADEEQALKDNIVPIDVDLGGKDFK